MLKSFRLKGTQTINGHNITPKFMKINIQDLQKAKFSPVFCLANNSHIICDCCSDVLQYILIS